jgi:hypothetical protein
MTGVDWQYFNSAIVYNSIIFIKLRTIVAQKLIIIDYFGVI